jgi:hypothetical protein
MAQTKKTTTTATTTATKPKAAPKPKVAEAKPAPAPKTASLQELGLKHNTDKATYHKFCVDYEKHLPSGIESLMEIGVGEGNSIRMWAEWLPKAKITGVDVANTSDIEVPANVTLLTTDRPPQEEFDVIVDDGSHMWRDQIQNFNLLVKNAKKAYIIEDIHTSLNKAFKLGPTPTYTNGSNVDESFPALDFQGREHEKILIKNGEKDSWSVIFLFKS